MATDLSTTARTGTGSVNKQVTMSGTPGNVLEVNLPEWCRSVDVQFFTSAGVADTGKIADSGTDAAAIGTDYQGVPSGNAYRWSIAPGRSVVRGGATLYLAGGTASGVAQLTMRYGA